MNIIEYFFKASNNLKLEYYEIYVSEDVYGAIRGDLNKITEIYIPELELSINQCLKPVNIFLGRNDRYEKDSMNRFGVHSKLIKTVTISKKSDIGKKLIRLTEFYKKKKENEAELKKLFDMNDNN
jgi:hypothetical protein